MGRRGKMPPGITRVGERYQARPTRGSRRRRRFDTLNEATAYLRGEELRGPDVSETLRVWLEGDRPRQVRASTLSRDRQIIRRLPADFLRLPLVDVTASDVLQVVGDWPGKTGTRKRVRTTLQAFFTWCAKSGRLDSSPARDVAVVATDGGRQPNPFTWAEIDQVAEQVGSSRPDVTDALLIAAHTGVRAGELRALRVSDYRQVPYPRLVVSRSHPENGAEAAPKSGRSREIPLDGVVIPIVERLARGRDLDAYLVTTRSGAQFNVRNARRDIHWDTIAAGHDWHDLRHTAAVEWAQMSGVLTSSDIQRLLGHASLTTTERYLAGLSGTLRHTQISAAFQRIVPSGGVDSRHTPPPAMLTEAAS